MHWHSLCISWLGDAIWRHITESTVVQVMAYCLMVPNDYLNQCWFPISWVVCQLVKTDCCNFHCSRHFLYPLTIVKYPFFATKVTGIVDWTHSSCSLRPNPIVSQSSPLRMCPSSAPWCSPTASKEDQLRSNQGTVSSLVPWILCSRKELFCLVFDSFNQGSV